MDHESDCSEPTILMPLEAFTWMAWCLMNTGTKGQQYGGRLSDLSWPIEEVGLPSSVLPRAKTTFLTSESKPGQTQTGSISN